MPPEAFEAGPHQRRLGVLCTGLQTVGIHHEYVFRLSHPCGCSWVVQKRYRDLLQLHEQLQLGFSGLPEFPPKRSLSERFIISEQDAATRRVVALQSYLQRLCLRGDALEAPSLLEELGATVPSAVRAVRVTRWHVKENKGKVGPRSTADAELEVRPDISAEGCCRPVEGFEVEVVLESGKGLDPFTAPLGAPLCVAGLPCGAQAELRVRAVNILGRSEPVALRISVPLASTAFNGAATASSAVAAESGAGNLPEGCTAARPYPSKMPQASRVPPHSNSVVASASLTTQCLSPCAPLFSGRRLGVGSRVQAIWAGDGGWYDAVIRRLDGEGWATVDWLRPAPLGDEPLRCVCEVGGDDTLYRRVNYEKLRAPGPVLSPDSSPGRSRATSSCSPRTPSSALRVVV